MKKILLASIVFVCCITSSCFSQNPIATKYLSLVNVVDSTTVPVVNARMFYNQQRRIVQCYFDDEWHDWASNARSGNAITVNGSSVNWGGSFIDDVNVSGTSGKSLLIETFTNLTDNDYVNIQLQPEAENGYVVLSYNCSSCTIPGASAINLTRPFAQITSNNTRYNFNETGLRINPFTVSPDLVASARLHLPPGTTSIAPMLMTSGPLRTSKAVGNWGFLTDKLYFTITTGIAEKEITLNDNALTANRLPLVTTNGRLSDFATGSAGTLLRSNGTIPAWSTVTMPNTISANSIFVANSANTLVELTPTGGQSIRRNAGNTLWEAYTPSSGGTPAGSDTELQFNDAGAFGASSTLKWNKITNTLTVGPAMRIFSIDKTFDDVFIGQLTGNYTTTGPGANVGIGYASLQNLSTGEGNVTAGRLAGSAITSGSYNVYLGLAAGTGTDVVDNVAIGRQALDNLTTTALGNIGIGNNSGNSTTGSKNVAIGYNVEHPSQTADGQLTIQNIIYGTGNTNASSTISTGNIGIGQNAPAYEFHITGNTNNKALLLVEDDGGNDALDIAETGGSIVIKTATLPTDNTQSNAVVRTSGGVLNVRDIDAANINTQTTDYTLVLADRSKQIEMNVAIANTVTVPLNATVAFPVGTRIPVFQYGVGVTTIVATGGVTIRSASGSLALPAQYASGMLEKRATDEWYFFNGTQAAQVKASFSQVGAATTVFTVSIGATQANTTYNVQVTPTAALSAAFYYVTNKTTTTFDVTYLAGLTGTVTFDWLVTP